MSTMEAGRGRSGPGSGSRAAPEHTREGWRVLIIPIETVGHTEDALLVILDGSNVDRMWKSDPAEVVLRDTGRTLVNPTVLICCEKANSPELARLLNAQARDVGAIIRHLQRGWKFRPEAGDHDRGPEHLREGN